MPAEENFARTRPGPPSLVGYCTPEMLVKATPFPVVQEIHSVQTVTFQAAMLVLKLAVVQNS